MKFNIIFFTYLEAPVTVHFVVDRVFLAHQVLYVPGGFEREGTSFLEIVCGHDWVWVGRSMTGDLISTIQ